ncbi:MAG: hypothetical protein WD875_05775 [Pirellulales bacterium]
MRRAFCCTTIALAFVAIFWTARRAHADDLPAWQIDLVDGGRIVGPVLTDSIRIATEFGTLDVPLEKIADLRPGFVSRPEWQRKVDELIAALGDDKAATRESAERELRGLGSRVREVLDEAKLDADAERRQRARRVLASLPTGSGVARAWPRRDIIVAGDQRFAGKIATPHIDVAAAWGNVRVPLAVIEVLSPPASRRPVDLLKEVDLERDAIAGKWDWQGAALVSSPSNRARVQIPFAPPAEYELQLKVTPISGRKIRGKAVADSLFIGVVVAGRPCYVAVGAFADIGGGPFSGLDTIDGKRTHLAPLHKGKLLELGEEAEMAVRVRRDGVQLSVDGEQIFAWQGEPQRLSVTPDWRLGDSRYLGIGAHQTTYKVSELRLVPIDDPMPPTNLKLGDWAVTLRDGSLIAGRVDAKQELALSEPIAGEDAKSIALGALRAIRLDANAKGLQLFPLSDSPPSASLGLAAGESSLSLETRFGRVSVPFAAIREAIATVDEQRGATPQ